MERYFEWDEAKNQKNQKNMMHLLKRQSDPLRISIQDRHTVMRNDGKPLRMVKGLLILFIAHTIFDEGEYEIVIIT